MISRDTIAEVKNRIDIVDVISDFVTLKRSGQNYKALSPFNDEKTPSFYVVPGKGIFKDFSSGKGGDAITFVMEHEGMTYTEAIRFLAKKYGVEIKEEAGSEKAREEESEREGLYILMAFAKDYYRNSLFHTEEGKGVGLSYFHERGFNDRTLEKFELGYALEGWSHLMDEAVRKSFNKELLEKTGLVVKNEEGRTYDRFRGRVIFPVHNLSGKVIAFGARMMGKEKNQPKYINSPETPIYHKSNVLYGLHLAKNAIRQKDTCYLVEGYTDVISMHQSGVENVVASSGTALTEDQIRLIRRFTENVTVLFDGDAAGIKAALRGIDLILKGGLNVRVVLLPDSEDPDSYSRKVGTTAFQKYLAEKAKDFISFKSGLYASEAGNDPVRKAESIKEIVNSIALIPDPVKRSVYIQETSHQLKIGEPVLLSELNKILVKERRSREDQRYQASEVADGSLADHVQDLAQEDVDSETFIEFDEREIIRMLLNYFSSKDEDLKLLDYILPEIDDVAFTNPVHNEILNYFKINPEPRIETLLENCSNEAKSVITDLMTQKYDVSRHWGDKFHIYIPREKDVLQNLAYIGIIRLKISVIKGLIENNVARIREAEEAGRHDEADKFIDQAVKLKKVEGELAGILGLVVAR